MISVIIPTVDGREDHYRRCYDTYVETLEAYGEFEILTIANRTTCGVAWQEGADQALGEYIHFTADDLVPHDGWWMPAVESIENGVIPMPTIYGPDGREEPIGPETVGCTRVPFCSAELWRFIGPMIPLHYYTDNWFSLRAREQGLILQDAHGYDFTHMWAKAKRGAGMTQDERLSYDRNKFIHYVAHGYRP